MAAKRVDYVYDDLGRRSSLTRWADLDGSNLVARTDYVFDQLGYLTKLTHKRGTTTLDYVEYYRDKVGRITTCNFRMTGSGDDTGSYSYDATDQLTHVDYDSQNDEGYNYDDNGNRTGQIGDHNRLMETTSYRYAYDGEGNRTLRFDDNDANNVPSAGDDEFTVYEWDHRNRLVAVTNYASYANYSAATPVPSQVVTYVYDAFNQLVGRELDSDGDGDVDVAEAFVHNGGQIVLYYHDTAAGPLGVADLAHRYLWGPNTDELLADESKGLDGTPGTADDTAWALTDLVGSVGDLVAYSAAAGTFVVVKEIGYDSFGNIVAVVGVASTPLFLYTGRLFDAATGLQNNLHRWYDPVVGRWVSVDPIGFAAGDGNVYRYCGNGSMTRTDPSGLVPDDEQPSASGGRWIKAQSCIAGCHGSGPSYTWVWVPPPSEQPQPVAAPAPTAPSGLANEDTRLGPKDKWPLQVQTVVDAAILESTTWESLTGRAGYNVDDNRRYIETEKLGTIDLQHVVSAAMGPGGSSTILGLMVEVQQWAHGSDSAFQEEDIVSNVVGGVAWWEARKKGISIAEQVGIIVKNAKPKGLPHGRGE
ncbi:MAG: hypothetical protein NTW96_26465 [Planctomycetia bacterium]|nr:hypothetical protein [Planctomycetia bacterium]